MTDALVIVVSHNRVVAFFQKTYTKFWRWRNIRQCEQEGCNVSENKKFMENFYAKGWL